MAPPFTYPLAHPIKKTVRSHADGTTRDETIVEIGYRRPTVQDLCATDRAGTVAERNLILLGSVSGWTDKDIDRLDLADLNGAIAALEDLSPLPAEDAEPVEPAYEMDGDRYRVPLAWPIASGAGEDIGEIVLRRPAGGDLRAADQVKGDMCKAREMLARISELSKPQINRIDVQDFVGLTVLIGNFTGRGRPTGPTS